MEHLDEVARALYTTYVDNLRTTREKRANKAISAVAKAVSDMVSGKEYPVYDDLPENTKEVWRTKAYLSSAQLKMELENI